MEALREKHIQTLREEITKRVKEFCSKQQRGSQITVIRASRRTGFDPFYIRRALSGCATPVCDLYTILQSMNTPTVYIDDFIQEVHEFSIEFKKIHGIETSPFNLSDILTK